MLQIEDTLETKQSTALQSPSKCRIEEVTVIDNETKEDCDLCCGDTAKNNKLSKGNDEEIEKCKIIDAVKTEKNDGRGDC